MSEGTESQPSLPASALLRGYSEAGPKQPVSRIPGRFLDHLPADTSIAAHTTSGVRLELCGTARSVHLRFTVESAAERGAPTMPAAFSVWTRAGAHGNFPISAGDTGADIPLPSREADETVQIYLPEPIVVQLESISWTDGTVIPARPEAAWVVYGDSITQGWSASDPGLTWPAIAGRELGVDVINLGFAGAARGELQSAAHVAQSHADIITLAWGTNCWAAVGYDRELIEHMTRLFLSTVRQGHPETGILVISPIVRPAAEQVPNEWGATLADLRAGIESSVENYASSRKDDKVHLLGGLGLLTEDLLVDGIHPGDEGHARMAATVAAALVKLGAFPP